MNSRKTDSDGSGNWLNRLDDAEFAEGDEKIDGSVLEPPIDGADVPELCRLLHTSEQPKVRGRAAKALGSLASTTAAYDGERIRDELRRAAIGDDDRDVQAEVIDALYRHEPEEIDRLVETIREAIERNSDTDVTEFFLRWLTADRPEFRLVAASAMKTLGDESVVSHLKDAFMDSDRRVQSRAIEAYGRLGEQVAVEPLEGVLQSTDPMVRHAAATALSSIGTEAALEALLPAAKSGDDRLRRIAVEQLHRLDRERSAVVLARAVRDRSKTVRERAIVSLIELYTIGTSVRPADVRNRLIGGSEPSQMVELAELLSEVVTPEKGDIDGESRSIEQQAVWLLGEVAEATTQDAVRCELVDALENPDDTVAGIAAAYLRRLEGEELEAKLRSTSRDPEVSADTRAKAESILDTIKQNIASEIESESIEYTYVRHPMDYTDKHDR